ncbi:MAG: YbaK/EbsC family protein [Nitrososphaeria archaeon]|nr:YbaK/EbsC family protein [Nitrososphaeria archaeon]MDW7986213.1 YbaK/EbsC family protein [Nitrososphaerota archaeon]
MGRFSTKDLEDYMKSRKIEGEIIYLKPGEARTSIAAARAIKCSIGEIAKNIILVGSRGSKLIVVTSGDRKVDLEKVSNLFSEKFRLATPSEILEETGYSVGGVPPFGHLKPIRTIVDQSLKRYEYVYTSGGSEDTLMKIKVEELIKACGGEVLDLSI